MLLKILFYTTAFACISLNAKPDVTDSNINLTNAFILIYEITPSHTCHDRCKIFIETDLYNPGYYYFMLRNSPHNTGNVKNSEVLVEGNIYIRNGYLSESAFFYGKALNAGVIKNLKIRYPNRKANISDKTIEKFTKKKLLFGRTKRNDIEMILAKNKPIIEKTFNASLSGYTFEYDPELQDSDIARYTWHGVYSSIDKQYTINVEIEPFDGHIIAIHDTRERGVAPLSQLSSR